MKQKMDIVETRLPSLNDADSRSARVMNLPLNQIQHGHLHYSSRDYYADPKTQPYLKNIRPHEYNLTASNSELDLVALSLGSQMVVVSDQTPKIASRTPYSCKKSKNTVYPDQALSSDGDEPPLFSLTEQDLVDTVVFAAGPLMASGASGKPGTSSSTTKAKKDSKCQRARRSCHKQRSRENLASTTTTASTSHVDPPSSVPPPSNCKGSQQASSMQGIPHQPQASTTKIVRKLSKKRPAPKAASEKLVPPSQTLSDTAADDKDLDEQRVLDIRHRRESDVSRESTIAFNHKDHDDDHGYEIINNGHRLTPWTRSEKRQGWSGEWNQPDIQEVIQRLRKI